MARASGSSSISSSRKPTSPARIKAHVPGHRHQHDPRQGRNIGVSAIIALNDTEFLVLERDNRGIGVDDPPGARVVGSKRVFKIDIAGATDVTGVTLGESALPAGVIPVTKSPEVFIDIQANTLLPNGKQAEKWEGLAIGPRLLGGARLILTGNDNDYSVTQTGVGEQFDVYVDFNGNLAKCVTRLDHSVRSESRRRRHRDRRASAAWVSAAARRPSRLSRIEG